MLISLVADVKTKLESALQLRDNLDHYITGPIYPAFLKKLIPIFINCLKGPPAFISTSAEQVRQHKIALHGILLTRTRDYDIAYSKY